MSKDDNDSNKRFIDTIPSVSLKKDDIASTQDILDVISYLEKEKKLDSYRVMVRYLSTTSTKSLDDPLKEMGLTSRKAVKEVIKGIEGLERVNTDFSRLSEKIAPFTLHSAYLSSLNNLIKPFAGISVVSKDFQNVVSKMQPGALVTKEMQNALNRLPGALVTKEMQDALSQMQPGALVTKEMQDALRQASTPLVSKELLNALRQVQPGVTVTKEMQDAINQMKDLWKSLEPVTNSWKLAIKQIQPENFEPFLPESPQAVNKKFAGAPNPDRPVSQLVKTLETTGNELVETTRTVSNLWKPEPATISKREEAFLEDLYELATQTGKPDKEAAFPMFEPSNSEQQEIAQYLSKEGLAKLKPDFSISITEKGIAFAQKIRSEEPHVQPVFLVHGRDYWMKHAVNSKLEQMNLKPIKLEKEMSGGRTIIEKLLDVTEDIPAAVVLLSPDDLGAFKTEEVRPRARQNVIFEHGFFVGKFGRSKRSQVIVLCKGDKNFEMPSDIKGVELIRFPDGGKWKEKLERDLAGCGYEVSIQSRKLANHPPSYGRLTS